MKRSLNENLGLFVKVMDEVIERSEGENRSQIFNQILLPWMIINQRAMNLSQESVLDMLKRGVFKELLDSKSKRVQEGKLSKSTGGYSNARQGLSENVVKDLSDTLTGVLLAQHETNLWHEKRAILIDGTTTGLYSTSELKNVYPPSKNQHGESHWCLPRILMMHDLVTGIALRPEFGATSGDSAISETEMLHAAIERCPNGAIVVGDCNFGILRVIDMAQKRAHPVLLRLTASRAKKFLRDLKNPGECDVTWTPTNKEIKKYEAISSQKGRFIWLRCEQDGHRVQDVFLFTTLTESIEEIASLYRKRWCIEQDIRSLKVTMSLDKIMVRKPEMFRKEFILGVLAYNLVRDTMSIIAKKINIDPRRLSFSTYLFELRAFLTIYNEQNLSPDEQLKYWCDNPRINKIRLRKPQIRAVRHKKNQFPYLKGDRNKSAI
jgi:hypothetical protein